MAEIINSIEQMEDMFREIVMIILCLYPEENHSRVRFPWGSHLSAGVGSTPGWCRDEDVCFIYALPQDNPYNRQRDRRTVDCGGRDLTLLDEHTDVHALMFANYGPNAYNCARDIRDGLFSDSVRRLLRSSNFALVTDTPAIKRAPEFLNGEWWNRVDVNATFNEFVRRESVMPVIEEISVTAMAAKSDGSVQAAQAIVTK